ncbi:UNVERIFIED_CONTAM: hypothetical protein Sradi_5396600 [Sesamum radiatum]|uniref:Uncharacterized protein n=1 Tax=Sesamum radiatum TaxID=300843 RepID=A0AAW2LT55_SESRA
MLELREGSCYPEAVVGVNVGLACVDAVIAFIAFYQDKNCFDVSWVFLFFIDTLDYIGRPFILHRVNVMLVDKDPLKKFAAWLDPTKGYFLYFVLTLIAACKGWVCWSHSCGFIVMAFPKILFVAAFLLLLSFWVDLCHQSNDDDEDEYCSSQEALLETTNISDSNANSIRKCFLLCVNSHRKPSKSCDSGLLLFLKMRKVRSERASTEMRKLFYHWHEQQIDGVYTSLLLVLYYFIGSSVPSAFVLLVMRELPPPLVVNRLQESRTIAFIREHSVEAHPQHWTATTSVQTQVLMLLAFLDLSL